MRRSALLLSAFLLVPATMARADNPGRAAAPTVEASSVFKITTVATLNNPWAMTFFPSGRVVVTQKSGELRIVADGRVSAPIRGVPAVSYVGQNGLLDVALSPQFKTDRLVYLTFAEPGPNNTSGLAVGLGKFVNEQLKYFKVVYRDPGKVGSGQGQMAGRMAFAPDGSLFVSSGERQLFTPAQSPTTPQGKMLHMTARGVALPDHPFAGGNEVTPYVWTLGHRNPLGLAFDPQGRLWEHENGPQGGDEFNLIERGTNYGWPIVSNGRNYGSSFDDIPNHDTRPDFNAPEVWWDPSIAPSGLIFYTGTLFPAFTGNAFMGALAGQELVRLTVNGSVATETTRYAMHTRIREVEQGPDGAIWVLEDGSSGRLLKLTPL